MISTDEFLDLTKTKDANSQFKLGKIDPSYSSGSPKIVFDGETVATTKTYKRLSSYTPSANDRVLLIKISGSYVVMGKIV